MEGLGNCMDLIDIDVEILCMEDGSEEFLEENSHCCAQTQSAVHSIAQTNQGRISTRKALANKAKYSWLLFLDADVELENNLFLKAYLPYLDGKYDAVYGGCSYQDTKPNQNELLRWTYGKTYEDISAERRNKLPYKHIVSANFLIKKTVFLELSSQINSEGYGYDILFGSLMKAAKTKVLHIDNAVIHKGLDDNETFLDKVEKAVETAFKLQETGAVPYASSTLLNSYKRLKSYGLAPFIGIVFKALKKPLKRQLLSKAPNVKLLQFYKLGYLCALR